VLAGSAAEAEKVLRIGSYSGAEFMWPEQVQWIAAAAEQLGYRLEFVSLPPERSLSMAASGRIDGDFFRQPLAVTNYHSLMPVEVPLETLDYWLYQRADRVCPKNAGEVKTLKPVGVLGHKYFDFFYKISEVGFEQVASFDAGIKMLKVGRADYLAFIKDPRSLKAGERLGVTLKTCLTRPLLSLDGYLYLHEKHKDLIPEFEAVLSTLIAESS